MSPLREEIRRCERLVKEWRTSPSWSIYKLTPKTYLNVSEREKNSFYGIFVDLESERSFECINPGLVWGFKPVKSTWYQSHVLSCNFGGPNAICDRTFRYSKAQEIALSKARKLARIIARRTGTEISEQTITNN